MKTRVKWVQDMMFVGETGSGHALVMDGAPDIGGRNLGPRPMEMLLLGLGGCAAIDVVLILKRGREAITDCDVEIDAERAATDPKVFTQIRMHFIVTGRKLDANKVDRAIKLSAEKYCSATAILGATATITHDFEIRDVRSGRGVNSRTIKPTQSGVLLALLLVALNLRLALASPGPVLESLRSDLHLSYGVAGLLTSLPVICMGLFAPLAMPLSTRLGSKQTILGALLLVGLATFLRAYANLLSLMLSSLLIGAGIAVLGPLLNTCVKQSFPQNSARISGWITTALCLGAALAAGSSAALSTVLGWPCALSSWSLLAFIAAWQWQRNIPEINPQSLGNNALPWRQPRAWLLLMVFGMNSLVFYGLLAWLAPAYMSYGLSAASAGRLLGAFALVQILGTLLVSALPNQQRERRPALVASGACTLAGMLALWLAPLAAPYLWMALLGAGTAALFALTLILPLDYSESPTAAGAWTAMMSFGGYLIAATGPYLCGVLRDMSGSYAPVFAGLCGISAFALLLCTRLGPATAR